MTWMADTTACAVLADCISPGSSCTQSSKPYTAKVRRTNDSLPGPAMCRVLPCTSTRPIGHRCASSVQLTMCSIPVSSAVCRSQSATVSVEPGQVTGRHLIATRSSPSGVRLRSPGPWTGQSSKWLSGSAFRSGRPCSSFVNWPRARTPHHGDELARVGLALGIHGPRIVPVGSHLLLGQDACELLDVATY